MNKISKTLNSQVENNLVNNKLLTNCLKHCRLKSVDNSGLCHLDSNRHCKGNCWQTTIPSGKEESLLMLMSDQPSQTEAVLAAQSRWQSPGGLACNIYDPSVLVQPRNQGKQSINCNID
jgi:hypothetical protein